MNYTIDDIEIFVTTHNRRNYLRQSIDSILKQTVKPSSITILDNDSTDDTELVAISLHSHGVKYIKTHGFLGNFNKAREIASKKFLMLFHDDDILGNRYLELAIEALNKHDDVTLITVKGYTEFTDNSVPKFSQMASEGYYLFNGQKEFAKHMYFIGGVAYSTAIYRTQDFIKTPLEYEKYNKFNDWPFMIKIANCGKTVMFDGPNLLLVRRHSGQDTWTSKNSPSIEQIINWDKLFCESMQLTLKHSNYNIYEYYDKFIRTLELPILKYKDIGFLFKIKAVTYLEGKYTNFVSSELKSLYTFDEVLELASSSGLVLFLDRESGLSDHFIRALHLLLENYCKHILEEHSLLHYPSQYKPYIYVCAPVYRKNSNGVRILYELSAMIRQQGFRSKVLCYEEEIESSNEYVLPIPSRYNESLVKLGNNFPNYRVKDDDIVVYSEIISDNPLGAKNVVRYLLNRPSYITGCPVEYGENDYIVSYSYSVDSNLPSLFILNDDREYFYPIDFRDKEDLVCIYYGKVIDPKIRDPKLKSLIDTFEQKIVITREFPRTRRELAELLRRSRLLVSLDPISSISYEATLCATPSLIVNDIFGFSHQKFNIPLHGIISNPAQYDEAIKDVKLAFEQCENALEENERNLSSFLYSVVNHFETINSNVISPQIESYRQIVHSRNRNQAELDDLRYSTHMKSMGFGMNLTSKDYLSPLGRKLRSFLIKIGFKHSFVRTYILAKNWVQGNKLLANFIYKSQHPI